MTGRLTTHVLDTAHGCPAAGVPVRLLVMGDEARELCATVTNADGRCDAPLLEGAGLQAGTYELRFSVGAYFARWDATLPDPAFLDDIGVRFTIMDATRHTHVPLLVSPYGYSTYRGS